MINHPDNTLNHTHGWVTAGLDIDRLRIFDR